NDPELKSTINDEFDADIMNSIDLIDCEFEFGFDEEFDQIEGDDIKEGNEDDECYCQFAGKNQLAPFVIAKPLNHLNGQE
ncbi:MAG: hypothetical protein EZS28_055053, partial [Streblomastix strix]